MRLPLLLALLLLAACRPDKTPDLMTVPAAMPPPPSAPAAASKPEVAPAAPTPAETARKTAASPARRSGATAPRAAGSTAPASSGPCASLRGAALEACIDREARAGEGAPAVAGTEDAEALREFREAQAARDRELLERDAEDALAEEGRRPQDDRWREDEPPPYDPREEGADAYADVDPREDPRDPRYYEEDELPPPEDYPPEDEDVLYEEPPEDDGYYDPRR